MKDLTSLQKHLIGAELHGHCRVDYTDPITGKVIERIEGDNHVFMDQFMAQNFQNQSLSAGLLITNGENDLDTDLPWMPGTPIGYGTPTSEATGIYQGSFRQADSYINRITQEGVTNLYVYDFLTTQIPDTIRYIGLNGSNQAGVNTTPFMYRWPRDSCTGIYDIEHKTLFFGGTCQLSSNAGGAGELYIYRITNEPAAVAEKIDLFSLCDKPDNYWALDTGYSEASRGYKETWGYDYENQTLVLKLMRYFRQYIYSDGKYHYQTKFKDDFWVISKDGTAVLKHFQYTWTIDEANNRDWMYDYHFWTGNGFPPYVRLYGDRIYGFSKTCPEYADTQSPNVFYVYQYDITTGDISYEQYDTGHDGSHPLMASEAILYCYKGYTFSNGYYDRYNGMTWGFHSTKIGVVPMYDIYTDEIYTNCPIILSETYNGYYLMEKGQTSVYGKTWNIKPYLGGNDRIAAASMPFAYTAYQLPSDAPVRPKNSAVTIAYGLTIKW